MKFNFVDLLIIVLVESEYRNSEDCNSHLGYDQYYVHQSDEKVAGEWVTQEYLFIIADIILQISEVVLQLTYLENKAQNGHQHFPDGRLDVQHPISKYLQAVVEKEQSQNDNGCVIKTYHC